MPDDQMTPEEEAFIFRMLDHVKTRTLDRHLWRHPEDLIQLYRLVVEDASDTMSPASVVSMQMQLVASKTDRRVWGNWRIGHIEPAHRLSVVAALHPATLTQEEFDFLLGVDLGARFGSYRPEGYNEEVAAIGESLSMTEFEQRAARVWGVDDENRHLAEAFAAQMVAEAVLHRQRVLIGMYEMARVPLAYLDSLIGYEALRLIISPVGIAASIVGNGDNGPMITPLWWSPEGHTAWLLGGRLAFALDVLMSCIWRDACVVRQRAFQPRPQTGGHRSPANQTRQQRKIRLPRTVNAVAWSTQAERETIIRSRHTVRAFFRTLPEGWHASEEAAQTARQYGYPAPPDGYTFVRPHQRGSGEAAEREAAPPRIVCTGLQTAAIALNWSS